jgi:hypothetical protein
MIVPYADDQQSKNALLPARCTAATWTTILRFRFASTREEWDAERREIEGSFTACQKSSITLFTRRKVPFFVKKQNLKILRKKWRLRDASHTSKTPPFRAAFLIGT